MDRCCCCCLCCWGCCCWSCTCCVFGMGLMRERIGSSSLLAEEIHAAVHCSSCFRLHWGVSKTVSKPLAVNALIACLLVAPGRQTESGAVNTQPRALEYTKKLLLHPACIQNKQQERQQQPTLGLMQHTIIPYNITQATAAIASARTGGCMHFVGLSAGHLPSRRAPSLSKSASSTGAPNSAALLLASCSSSCRCNTQSVRFTLGCCRPSCGSSSTLHQRTALLLLLLLHLLVVMGCCCWSFCEPSNSDSRARCCCCCCCW